jgi:UDP-N-acetyl-D-mannosaminuronate dehydrogenase
MDLTNQKIAIIGLGYVGLPQGSGRQGPGEDQ